VFCGRCGESFHAVEWALTGQVMCPSCGHIGDIVSTGDLLFGGENASDGDQSSALEDYGLTADELKGETDELE
jgi:hypothetical protein